MGYSILLCSVCVEGRTDLGPAVETGLVGECSQCGRKVPSGFLSGDKYRIKLDALLSGTWPCPIPVSERLPELGEPWATGDRSSESVLFWCGCKYDDGTIKDYHWMKGRLTEDARYQETQARWFQDGEDEAWGGYEQELVTC